MSEKTTTFSVSMPDTMRQKAEQRIAAGDFGSTSEYVRWLIRNDLSDQQKLENLRVLVSEGVDDLEHEDVTVCNQDLVDVIKAKSRARLTSSHE